MVFWVLPLLVSGALASSGAGSGPTSHVKRANTTAALRILPLGASVTFGVGSTTGNSYRDDLRTALVAAGSQVNMVGTQKNGDFTNNQCEAYPGFIIDQLVAKADVAVPKFQPNLVLADLGTNNCNSGNPVPDAGKNVSALIQKIYAQSPGATVVLMTLFVNKVAAQDQCRLGVNTQYASLVTDLQKAGSKIVLADMRAGPNALTTADLNDTRHPNDGGYVKMSKIWLAAIQDAETRGFLSAPAANGLPADGDAPQPSGQSLVSGDDSPAANSTASVSASASVSAYGSASTPSTATVTTSSGTSSGIPASVLQLVMAAMFFWTL